MAKLVRLGRVFPASRARFYVAMFAATQRHTLTKITSDFPYGKQKKTFAADERWVRRRKSATFKNCSEASEGEKVFSITNLGTLVCLLENVVAVAVIIILLLLSLLWLDKSL